MVALGGLMAYAPIAGAQDSTAPKPATPPPADGSTPPPRARRGAPGGQLQAILNKLDLTDDQKDKVKPIVKDQTEKLSALRADSSLSREDQRAKMKEITDATDVKLKAILTPEQFTKFQDLKKTMGRPGRPAPPAGAGDAAPKQN